MMPRPTSAAFAYNQLQLQLRNVITVHTISHLIAGYAQHQRLRYHVSLHFTGTNVRTRVLRLSLDAVRHCDRTTETQWRAT